MSWIVDGSNVLGRAGADRESDESKRQLLRSAAHFAKRLHTRVVIVFDGQLPANFAPSSGSARAEFSFPRPADDRIAEIVGAARGKCHVVTSDGRLAARVQGRSVTLHRAEEFRAMLESAAGESTAGDTGTDWETYFSDPKNRNI